MTTIAVLGTGRIGTMHADAIAAHPRAQLGPVYDTYEPSAVAVSERLGVSVSTPEASFADPSVDAVLVASATPTHADFIEQAVAAGKPILCEKPIDLSLERVDACAKAIAGSNVPVQIGFNRRFDPGHRAAYDAVRNGRVGDIHQVIITSRDPELPPRSYMEAAGGFLRDMTIHDLDMARFLLDEEPVEIFATGACLVDPAIGEAGDVDTAAVTLRTASGRICQISNSRRATYGYDQRIEVHGATGMLSAANVAENLVEQAGPEGFTRAPSMHFFLERYEAAYAQEMAHFVDALVHGARPKPDAQDGLRALLLADAAALSLAENRPVALER